MPQLTVELILPAPPEKVWDILTDFERYGERHPYQTISGAAEQMSVLTTTTRHVDSGRIIGTERAIVWKAEPNKRLELIGGRLTKRFFHLEPHDRGTLLRHGIKANFLFAPGFKVEGLQVSFEVFNRAIAKRIASPGLKRRPSGMNRHQRRSADAKKKE